MAKPKTRVVEREVIETERVCPVCRKRFWGIGRAVYDSPECKRQADYQRHAEERRKARMEKYYSEKKTARP